MITFLEILTGPLQGSRYRVEDGLQIGRSKGHIQIEDPKASALHAQIKLDERGQYIVLDLDSSNGLLINGHRVKRVALLPGVSFEIGRTKLKVIQVDDQEAADFSRVLTWRNIIQDSLKNHSGHNEVKPGYGQVFSPQVLIEVVQGIQTNQKFVLSYGPRQFGANSLDIELEDMEAPALAFEIVPRTGGAELINNAGKAVLLNNSPVVAEVLQDGDSIKVGQSVLVVRYL